MPPKQLKNLQFREFSLIVAQVGDIYVALGRGSGGREVRVEGDNADDVEQEAKEQLLKLSETYIGLPEAIALFRRVFPEGFADPYYLFRERSYKDRSSASFLATTPLAAFHQAQSDEATAKTLGLALRDQFGGTDILHTVEKAKFRDALAKRPADFARALGAVLIDPENAQHFDAYAGLLKAEDACSWPNVTYFPFLAQPSRWLFIKPTYLQKCADRLGIDVPYESEVSAFTYGSFLSFGRTLEAALGVLKPVDFIDIHTFIFAVNYDGYVAEISRDRDAWHQGRASDT